MRMKEIFKNVEALHVVETQLLASLRTASLLVLLLAAVSCTKDTDIAIAPNTDTTQPICFEIGFAWQGAGGMQTRAATDKDFHTTWEDGDAIGIFAVKYKKGETATLAASGNYIQNVKLTYSNATGTWTPATPLYFPAEENMQLDFYAYYPYMDLTEINPPTQMAFGVQTDQSGNGFNASDLLFAKALNVNKGSTASLSFNHLFALVEVDISERADNTPLYVADKLKVSLSGVQNYAMVDLSHNPAYPIVITGISPSDILMHRMDMGDASKYVYRAIVPVQAIVAGHKMFTFRQDLDGNGSYADGNEFSLSYTLPAQADLVPGKALRYKIKTVETATPDPNHLYAVSNYYPHVGRVQGVVFSVTNGGKNGKIVSLDQSPEGLIWSSVDDRDFGATSVNDGQANTNTIKAYKLNNPASTVTFPAFEWCIAKGAQWYLPARDELRELYTPKAAVNTALAGISGTTQLDDSVTYWSSSEFNKNNYVWNVLLLDGHGSAYLKSSKYYVRAISAF